MLPPLMLWYDKPATKWVEALPVGNGRLGAMVFGGTDRELLQLNEDTLYAGRPYDPNQPSALKALPEARRLIFAGNYHEAQALVGEQMMADPIRQMPYQPVGNLDLHFPGHASGAGYRRDLDLDAAIATVSYTVDGVRFRRDVFASPVDQVIVVHLTADRPGSITFAASMSTPQEAIVQTEDGNTLVMRGRNGDAMGIPAGLTFVARTQVIAREGSVSSKDDHINVTGADEATLLIAIGTSYRNFHDTSGDPDTQTSSHLSSATSRSVAHIREDHVREHQRLFRRVHLDLGRTRVAGAPTDQRLDAFQQGTDPDLAALYFQYGRYLLICSSRPGTQPANLQGVWNDSMTPPWESKYTVNINAEMNYWPAEPTNLAECHEPLLRLVHEIAESGRRTAEVHYGARGWVCHHNTDLWRATAPIDGPFWGFWPTGGAWLCTQDRKSVV